MIHARQVHQDPQSERIVIGDPPSGAAPPAGLPVMGGVWQVDPLDPATTALVISDLAEARPSVVALFGLKAWDEVQQPDCRQVPWAGWAAADATRLALLRWLSRFSSEALDPDLLAMESEVLRERLAEMLDEDPPDHLSGPPRNRALGIAADIATGHQPGLPQLPGLVADYLQLCADRGDAEAHAALASLPAHGFPEVTAYAWSGAEQLTAAPAGTILDEGTALPPPVWRNCGVDWELTPNGVFAATEDAVMWRITDRREVEVRVVAGPRPSGSWLARLHSPQSAVPVAIVPLHRDNGTWSGRAAPLLPAIGDHDEFWVDITDGADPRPARKGAARAEAAGRRWAARGVLLARLHLSAGALLDTDRPGVAAKGCLERARSAFAEAEMIHDDEAGNKDARWQFAIGRTLQALLARDEQFEAEDVAAELTAAAELLAGRTGSAWVSVDLTDPGWSLSVAEWALLVPQ